MTTNASGGPPHRSFGRVLLPIGLGAAILAGGSQVIHASVGMG